MPTYYDLVRCYSLDTGTGSLREGLAVPGFRTFTGADVPNGQEIRYKIQSGLDKEIGLGSVTDGVLTRATVSYSTNGGAKIDVGLNAIIENVFSAEDMNDVLEAAETIPESVAASAASAAEAAASALAAVAAQEAAEDAAAGVPAIDTDGTFAANSDLVVPSQKAAKTYVDAAITAIKAGVSASFDTLAEIATALGTKLTAASNLSDVGSAATAFSNIKQAATTSATGVSELATAAETTTGTDAARVVTPDGLAGSDFGKTVVSILVFDDSENVAVGDGAGDVFWRVPSTLNTYNLVAVAAKVQTAGTTGTTDIQIHNVTQAVDMLTAKLRIDSTEKDTLTAANAATITGANADVATGDELRFDVDAVSTTPPKGLLVELTFQLP